MRLAHGFASRVVLIGSSASERSGRDRIERHLEKMRDLLIDRVRWGVDRKNCVTLVDPATQGELRDALDAAADGVSRGGLLLVHFVGPMHLDSSQRLSLLLPGYSLQFELLRWYIRHSGEARRLVVLDVPRAPAEPAAIADAVRASLPDVHLVLHAPDPSAGDGPGLTDHLVDLLDRGVPHRPHLLGLRSVQDTFHSGQSLILHHPPGAADDLPLVRNPALYRAGRTGQILLTAGEPHRPDHDQAVILVLRHEAETGTLGVVLNRPGIESAPAPAWPGAVHDPAVVFDGGPVAHEGLIPLTLLRAGAEAPAQFRGVGGRLGTLPRTCRPPAGTVERFRLFRGYVGWGPGELEADIASGSVLLAEVDLDLVLSTEPGDLWRLTQQRV